MKPLPRKPRTALSLGLLALAACIWLPCLHLCFRKDIGQYRAEQGLSPVAGKLAGTYMAVWSEPAARQQELAAMRRRNPEWDFMSRTFMVLALANMALREPQRQDRALEVMDAIIDDTLERERHDGYAHFLLAYGHGEGWVVRPPRSMFVDGETALMLAVRRMVAEKPAYADPLHQRVELMLSRMHESPVLCAESYPDECWLFCNTVALAATRLHDLLDGTDHAAFLDAWVRTAKATLADPHTGMLISAFAVDGTPAPAGPGPEGSTIWLVAHMLQIVDPAFADDQYRRARAVLGGSVLGFGYSREWPRGQEEAMDIDSGPVIPLLGASASASGLAILAAAAFDDKEYFHRLMTALECAGFPAQKDGGLRYQASNQVGDAVLLYAMTEGPLWNEVRRRMRP